MCKRRVRSRETLDKLLSPTSGDDPLTEFLDSTVNDIDRRLDELKDEVARLEAARTALLGGRRRPGRPRTAGAGRTRGASVASRTRASQALELVRNSPGITIPQIAKEMGIEPNYLYRVLPRLEQEGQIKRDGQGWVPVGG